MDIVTRKNAENVKLSESTPNEIDSKLSEIQKFYDGKNVLLTGGTGFMGKILIDKLLRTCPGIGNIYLLVRSKKGKDIHTRLDEIFDDLVFERLREEVPKFRNKIVAIGGDCELAGLGLRLNDRQVLISNVQVVFHAAATVRFDEKLTLALSINVCGTQEVLELCTYMTRLEVVMHVSSIYSNCHLSLIEEKFYKFPFHSNDLNRMIEKLDEESLKKVTPTIIGKWPNTYTFTKALAEDVVRINGRNLPIGLFRPAVVTSSVKEPVVGYIDNMYGPTGVIYGMGIGVLRTVHCDRNMNANIVPVDMTVNALIAATWDVAVNQGKSNNVEDIPIYNYIPSVEKPLTWGEFIDLNIKYGFENPFSSAKWYLSFRINKTAMMNKICVVFLHILPAMLIDSLAMCVGQQPKLLKVYKKIHKFTDVIAFFATNEWMLTNNNIQSLWTRLSNHDQGMFNFDMKTIDWVEYSRHYISGIRMYLLKDDLSTVDAARRKWNRFYWLHQMLKAFFSFIILYFFWSTFSEYFYRSF